MCRPVVLGGLAAVLWLVAVGESGATTWGPKKMTCPVCQASNTLQVPMSYGSYIYGWPSKYQYVFWPYIDPAVLHCCRQCGLTCFLGDFEDVPKEKREAVRKALAGVSYTFEDGKYDTVRMSKRLAVAEKVYRVLGRSDEFWCRFYRVLGYCLGAEAVEEQGAEKQKSQAGAAEARKKALALAEKMLKEKDREPVRKELLLISGAMRHFLKDDAAALADFRAAQALTYKPGPHMLEPLKKAAESTDPQKAAEAKEELARAQAEMQERAAGIDKYLSELLKDYISLIQKKEGPQDGPTRE